MIYSPGGEVSQEVASRGQFSTARVNHPRRLAVLGSIQPVKRQRSLKSRLELWLGILRYRLLRPLDETLMQSIAAHGIYGFYSVKLAPSLDEITVEYDASRLTPEQVEAALHRAGIPAVKEA